MKKLIMSTALIVLMSGCASTSSQRLAVAQRENAQLKQKVATLELQVSELQGRVDQSKNVLMIDGLKLEPPKMTELRFVLPPEQTALPPATPPALRLVGANVNHTSAIGIGTQRYDPLGLEKLGGHWGTGTIIMGTDHATTRTTTTGPVPSK